MKKNDRDAAQKRYWEDSSRISEIVNYVLFDGAQVVGPDAILDTAWEASVQVGAAGAKKSYRRTSDGAKLITLGRYRLIVYLENQTCVDYAMSERNFALEAACYHEQRTRIRREHRRAKDLNNRAEFLSGFAKSDRLALVLCIVLYYGKDAWDGARNLREIVDIPGAYPKLRKLANDNRIILVDVKRLAHPERLHTDLRETFSIIKYSSDKKKLKSYIKKNEAELQKLPEDAFDFVAYTTGSTELLKLKNQIRTKEDRYDMCEAILEIMEDSKKQGIAIGKRLGERRGKKQERQKLIDQYITANFAEGRLAEQIEQSLIKYFALSARQANACMKRHANCVVSE